MDMSLDEIIEKKMLTSHGSGQQAGSSDSIDKRGVSGQQRGSSDSIVKRGGSGGSSNGSFDGGVGPIRRGKSMARPSNRFSPFSKGDVHASRTHDMCNETKRRQMRGSFSTNTYKICISNLDFGVTSRDIQELFNEFGPLKTATVHYNRSGRSSGTANVVFYSKSAALKAVRKYNNVLLDGRSMKIKLTTDLSTVANLTTSLSKPPSMPIRGIRGVGGEIRGIRNNTSEGVRDASRERGGRGTEKKILTKEELDAELDSFVKSKKNC